MKKIIKYMCMVSLFITAFNLHAKHPHETKSLCVFDLLGANGPVFAQMKDYKIAALAWEETFQLIPYVNEAQAVADFKRGKCDAVLLTGTFSREFNRFTGTLDAVGALNSYSQLKTVINSISRKQVEPYLINGNYEVAGILPVGAAFLYVKDRMLVENETDHHEPLSNVKVAIMQDDPVQSELIGFIGATPEHSSLSQMYTKFIEGSVDATYGPAVVYEAMELYRGMQGNGGVIRFPLAQLTLQLIIHQDRFHADYAQQSRDYILSRFDNAVIQARNYENRIDAGKWIEILQIDQDRYHQVFYKTRSSLLEKGVYNGKMLKLMHLVRCKYECTANTCQEEPAYQ